MDLGKHKHNLFSLAAGGLFLAGLFLPMHATPRAARAASSDLFVIPGGGGDCSQGNPCDLQTALGQAVDGDSLYLAQGTYTGTGAVVITVTRSIGLYGGWDGSSNIPVVRDPDIHPTILDGEGTRQVVNISASSSPTLDGFTIIGGIAPDGGGVYINNASPVIQNNVITGNQTIDSDTYEDGRGGGIFVDGASNAMIAHNHILGNTSGYGGGIYHYGSTTITILANEIADNVSSFRGGGILIERAPDIIQANLLSGNSATQDGGGMLIWAAAPSVDANRIMGNSANAGGGISMGNNATPGLLNNLFISNTHDGVLVGSSSPVIVNNTIVGSGSPDSGDGISLYSNLGCTPPYCTAGSITNNIIVNYAIGIYGTGDPTTAIDYNDVWGNSVADYFLSPGVVIGTHNLSLDPLFANPSVDDYHLQGSSPCVEAGDPAGVPPAPPTDMDGTSRPAGDRVDIGADEFQLTQVFLPVVLKDHTP
jgi:hypothetical protein